MGIMALFKLPLNVVNVVAAIVTTGVIVDYGLGITYEYRYNLRIGTVVAVTLSAVTNIIGAGVLLFAKHPALYSTGVAMVICMVAGYLSSVIVVPSLCSIMGTSRKETEPQ
jgi:predicted RND superfamily exporter protein